jgi:hypothetical protein
LIIPLNIYAKEILNKYKNHFADKPLPSGITLQKNNEYLKELGKMAGLNESIWIAVGNFMKACST